MNNKGNMVGVYALELVIIFSVVFFFFVAMDEPIREDIIGDARARSDISADWNETLGNFLTAWNAVPWIILASGVGSLAIVAMATGR